MGGAEPDILASAYIEIDGEYYGYSLEGGDGVVPGVLEVNGIEYADSFQATVDINAEDASKGITGSFDACYCEFPEGFSWPGVPPF